MAADIMQSMRSGGILKLGGKSHKFFLIVRSEELPVCQSEAKRLAAQKSVRPSDIDSHGNGVFALNAIATK